MPAHRRFTNRPKSWRAAKQALASVALHPSPVLLPLARVVLSPRAGRRGAERPGDSRVATEPVGLAVERCREHLDALYVLAYLCLGDRDAAEDAVVQAVVNINADPAAAAGPVWIWRILSTNIYAQRDEAKPGLLSLARSAGLSSSQQEALALVVSGRRPGEAARLLGISTTHLYRNIRTGLQLLHASLQSTQPMEASE